MKVRSKKLNIISTIIVLMVLFACAISVTLSYFTATTTATGNISFYDLEIDCIVQGSRNASTVSANPTNLEFTASSLSRGDSSLLQQNDAVNGNITDVEVGLKLHDANSCPCFVRLWIDVYLVVDGNEDTTINYGEDLTLQWYDSSNGTYSNSEFLVQNDTNKNVYYVVDDSDGEYRSLIDYNETVGLFNAVKLNSNASVDLVGADIVIKVSYEAIQASNGAVASWASDSKGKYTNWS